MKLKRNVTKRFFVLSILLIIIIGTITFIRSKNFNLNARKIDIFSNEIKLSREINGDRLNEYASIKQIDQEYIETLDKIKKFKNDNKYKYVYVFIPSEDSVQYVYISDDVGINLGDKKETSIDTETLNYVYNTGNTQERIDIYNNEYGHTISVYCPIYDKNNNIVALIGVDEDYICVMINIIIDVMFVEIILVIIIFVIMNIGYSSMCKYVVKPIEILTNYTQEIVNNKSYENPQMVKLNTNDEIEKLSISISTLLLEIKNYIQDARKNAIEKENVRKELEIAQKIQTSVIPTAFPKSKYFEIFAKLKPAQIVSGDFYDFFFLDGSHLAFCIGDVSGKGIPAALFMMNTKALLKSQLMQNNNLDTSINNVNQIICNDNEENMFVTCFIAVLDIKTGIIRYVNAGHNPPMIKKADNSVQFMKCKRNLVIGALDDTKYIEHMITLNKGDTIILYTDGITEAFNQNDQIFSKEQIFSVISKTNSISEMTENLFCELIDFMGANRQSDDMTMIEVKLL